MKNIVCIIQARTGSTRLPNKIFLDLAGKPVLARVLERLQKSNLISKIIVAIPVNLTDDVIEDYIQKNFPEVGVFRGSEDDVLDRYYQAAKAHKADIIVRITSDCPLIDSETVDKVIQTLIDKKVDYAANVLDARTYPRGLDTEVFSFEALEKIHQEAKEKDEREHVTLYIRKYPEFFSTCNVFNEQDYSSYRLTIDEEKDYSLIKIIYERLLPQNKNFDLKEIVGLLKQNPELTKINQAVKQKNSKY